MTKHKIIVFTIILTLQLLIIQNSVVFSENNDTWWNPDWSYRDQIQIPIDTGKPESKYQPIDMEIVFSKLCWGKNESHHSIRIIFQNDDILEEIESQIYSIEFSDEEHILSCNIVFLIPEFGEGSEKYYIYYDDKEKSETTYPDHVQVEKAYYIYEPIPGYPFESHFFKITQHDYIVYGIAYEGEFLGLGTAHQITKFKENTKQITSPEPYEAWASFDYFYYYGAEIDEFYSTIQNVISKKIHEDGNIMVEVSMVSRTSNDDFQTTGTYKYYYCPSSDKRIYANVKHEALNKSHTYAESEAFGNICGLQIGIMKSPSIKELNFGRIFPYMHVYKEDGIIQEYKLDTDPEYSPEGSTILDSKDDVDLGERAWSSFDDGESGWAHSIIFDSNNIILSGTDERDGIQVGALEGSTPGLLGLETDLITFYFSRNIYEKGESYDLDIPEDLIIEFNAEFFTTESGGYLSIDEEAEIFQSLVKIKPSTKDDSFEDDVRGKSSLTAFIHLMQSAPMGTILSLITGKNFSYIKAELYHDDKLISTGFAQRFDINPLPNFKNKKLMEKIYLAIGIIDWRNISVFKKIKFDNLISGTYLIKIYKENTRSGESKFIGLKIIEVDGETSTHLYYRPQGRIEISVTDQNELAIDGAIVNLVYNNITISSIKTSDDGIVSIGAPCILFGNYILNIMYNGFVTYEEAIDLNFFNVIRPVKRFISLELYNLNLVIEDTWGLTPSYVLNPILTSDDMDEIVMLTAEKMNEDSYVFKGVYPAEYQIKIKYKSFELEETIKITGNNEDVSLIFPAEFSLITQTFDTRGIKLKDVDLIISRENKTVELQNNEKASTNVILPPAIYNIKVYYDGEIIGARKINVINNRTVDLITTKEPIFEHFYIYVITIGFFFIFISILSFRKVKILSFLKIAVIIIAIVSIFAPWWKIQGESINPILETSTKMYIYPPELITLTKTNSVIAGERGLEFLPELITNFVFLFPLMIFIGCIFIFFNIVFKRLNKIRLSLFSYSLGILLLILDLSIFYYGMSLLTSVGVGSFYGNGTLNITIPGEGMQISAICYWGADIGFYLILISIIILVFISLANWIIGSNRFLLNIDVLKK